MRPEPPARRFTLLDAMVLLAAAAAGLAGLRPFVEFDGRGYVVDPDISYIYIPTLPAGGWTPLAVARYVPHASQAATPPLFALSFAVLTLRLRRPRPRLRRVAAQPGATACAAAVLALGFGVVESVREWFVMAGGFPEDWVGALEPWSQTVLGPSGRYAAFAVALGWIGLAVRGRWRPEPSWIDRSGRVIGILWIVVYLLGAWLALQESIWQTPTSRRFFE